MRQVLTRTQGARGHAQALSGAAKEYSRDPAPPITGFSPSPRSCASSENQARDAAEARLKRRYARVAHRTGPGAAVEQPSREQSVQATCGYEVSDDDIYLRKSWPRPAQSDKPPCPSARVLLDARIGASGSKLPQRVPIRSFGQVVEACLDERTERPARLRLEEVRTDNLAGSATDIRDRCDFRADPEHVRSRAPVCRVELSARAGCRTHTHSRAIPNVEGRPLGALRNKMVHLVGGPLATQSVYQR